MVQAVTEVDETILDEYNDLPSENDPKGTRCYFYSVSLIRLVSIANFWLSASWTYLIQTLTRYF